MIETVGLGTVLAGFALRQAEIDAGMRVALEHGAEVVRDAWVSNIESDGLVLTGAYRDSVHIERDEDEVAVKTDIDYASILEHGDSRQVGHSVAQRATDEHHDDVLERQADVLRGVIR